MPVVILSMFFLNRFPGENDLLLVLTTPIWAIVGWEFHRGALKTLRNGSASMDTLISVGSTAAYGMSVVATFFPQVVGAVTFYDTTAFIVTLIFLQVALVDAQGTTAVHTGNRCIPAAGHLTGENFTVQANLMVNDSVWPAMKRAYEEASGDLVDRMIATLEAAQAAGGDLRGQQAAALLIVSGERQQKPWQGRLFDLRIDDHPRPVEELKRLVSIRKAWLLFEKSNELAHAQCVDETLSVLKQAIALQPDLAELRFRSTEILFMAGKPQQAVAAFRDVFSKEPAWAEMVPRLAAVRLLPNDPTLLKFILDQRV